MPHIVIEYSAKDYAEDQVNAMMTTAHAAALASGLFAESDIKVRAYPCAHGLVAGKSLRFVHLTVYLLSGRDQPTQKQLAEKILAQMSSLELDAASLSVDCRDMDRAVYSKVTTNS